MADPLQTAYLLTGPTGSGKSALGIELALRLDAEIISMDSMALYRGMDIGTAKPTSADRLRVRHHLLDVLDPWESASVAWWLQQAADCTRDIAGRGKRVLFVGGTPLYLKVLLRGLFEGPPADAALRQRLTQESERGGRAALHERLARVDPVSAARLHPHDLRRVLRALEVWELTGKPISTWQQQWHKGPRPRDLNDDKVTSFWSLWSFRSLILDLPRPDLYARIDARVLQMVADGLVEEVRTLRQLPRPMSREASQALGYKEIAAYLDGRMTLPEAVRQIQTRSRNFAKRQLSWFRHLPECRPVTRELTFCAWGLTMDGEMR